jgi:hypothetical protein
LVSALVVGKVNETSQGVASEPVVFTMPESAKPEAPAAEAELALLAAISPNGNGSAAGNGSALAVTRT